ncbi:MAG: GNAT family N-acetyltransferase [Myxococcota bacterium]
MNDGLRPPATPIRRPYTRARLDALVAFASTHALSRVHAPPARRLLAELAPPEGVIELVADGQPVFVGAVIDRCENLHDAALFEVLGWDGTTPLDVLLAEATPIAIAVGRRAGRAQLSLSLPARQAGALQGQGWIRGEASYVLERDLSPWPSPAPPAGAEWEDLSPLDVAEHYDAVRAAFAEDPGMMLPDLDTFAVASLGAAVPVRVLRALSARRGEAEIAFARVVLEDEGRVGYIASIGRAPAWKGRGLGPVALAEALRQLVRLGVARLRLGVTATNAAAVELYRRTGFVEVERWETWRRPLSEAG